MKIYRDIEFRQSGDRTIEGTIIRYGDEAMIAQGISERVNAGAMSFDDVLMNIQHDRKQPVVRTGSGLEFIDTRQSLSMKAKLPDTHHADNAMRLIDAGILRGLSVEMKVGKDRYEARSKGNLRIIEQAEMVGVALVDSPAYTESVIMRDAQFGKVELRQNTISGEFELGEMVVTSQQNKQGILVESGALELAPAVFLLSGYSYDRSLASTNSGSLNVEIRDDKITFNGRRMVRTEALIETRKRIRAGLISGVVPGMQVTESIDEEIDGIATRVIKRGLLCEINLVAHPGAANVTSRQRSPLHLV